MIKVLENVLTEKQQSAGLSLKEDEDFVYLMDGKRAIGTFSAFGVTDQWLRDAAEDYLLKR